MAFSLKEILMKQIKRRRLRNLVDKQTLWPSQASVLSRKGEVIGKCLRSSYYEKTGEIVTNPVSDNVTMMGYMGTMIEDGVIDLVKNEGIWENNNIKFEYNGVSGEIDIAIRPFNIETNEEDNYIVECKSCSGYYVNKEVFGYWEGRGNSRSYVKGKPKDKHLLQAAIYAQVGKLKDFKGCIIIYVSRDEADLAEFLITVDDDGAIYINGDLETRFKMADVFERYQLLKRYIDSGELPDRDYKPEYSDAEVDALYDSKAISKLAYENHKNDKKKYCDEECNYCPFKLKCLNQTVQVIATNNPFSEIDSTESTNEKPAHLMYGSL